MAGAASELSRGRNRGEPAPAAPPSGHGFAWTWEGRALDVGYDVYGRTTAGAAPILLLPAMSTVSARAEMAGLARRLSVHAPAVAVDWPGFGDNPRPELDYTPELQRRFLEAFVDHLRATSAGGAAPAVVAAGHAAGYAVDLEARRPGSFARLALVAPTWRGPLPTVMGGRRPVQGWVRRAVHLPVLGAGLYRLNVLRPVVAAMYRGHVFADPGRVTPAFLAEKMRVVRRPGARFASACFVTGALDPFRDRTAFLDAARAVRAPMLVVYGADTPPRSRAEMEALAELPGVASRALDAGALGVHEERPDAVADAIGPFFLGRSGHGAVGR